MIPHKTRVARVAPLAAAFAASDLTRLAITDGDFSLEMVRRSIPLAQPALLPELPDPVAPNDEALTAKKSVIIRADLVGMLRYVEPHPKLGMLIEHDRELFSIEALGVRTPVRAGGKGTITELLVVDGRPVEYGEALLVIDYV